MEWSAWTGRALGSVLRGASDGTDGRKVCQCPRQLKARRQAGEPSGVHTPIIQSPGRPCLSDCELKTKLGHVDDPIYLTTATATKRDKCQREEMLLTCSPESPMPQSTVDEPQDPNTDKSPEPKDTRYSRENDPVRKTLGLSWESPGINKTNDYRSHWRLTGFMWFQKLFFGHLT